MYKIRKEKRMSSMWPFWKMKSEPEAGVFELVMITGFQRKKTRHVLLVCRSLRGFLSEAFEWPDANSDWQQAGIDEAVADGWKRKNDEPI